MTITSPARGAVRAPADLPAGAGAARRPRAGLVIATAATLLWLVVAAAVHLTQGTADIDLATLWAAATGADVPQASAVLLESRLPRLAAALVVGGALGLSGAAMQSVARNPLASPETTGVGAGAYLALTVASATGLALGPLGSLLAAFAGGLAAAAAVIGLASGGTLSPVRLVLAGSVLTLGLASVTSVLLLLFPWETQGLFAWGAGSLSQNGMDAVVAVLPAVAVALAALMLLGRRLDLLQLGDDAAAALGVPVTSTRRGAVVCAVVLAAGAVTVAGPIGFVGLCAPAILRLAARRLPGLRRQRIFLLLSAAAGVALVLSADVLLRALFGAISGVTIPVGLVTSVIGAVFLMTLARRLPSGTSDGESLISLRAGGRWARRHPRLLLTVAAALLAAALVASVLVGDSLILLGDVANWMRGAAAVRIEIILESRIPRVAGALLAGVCLAIAGAIVQAVTRNPLADPGILGVAASAGLGAVLVITTASGAGDTAVVLAALASSALSAALLAVLGRGDQLRLVLVGIGIQAGASALTTLLILRTDPWSQTKAMTWLGGSTYGTTFADLAPMAALAVVAALILSRSHRDLDALQFDEISPRVWGVAVGRARLMHIGLAVALTAAATAAVGVIAFVGLVAPHAARLVAGKRHAVLLPLAALTGGLLVVVSDLVGRAAIAPAQLPAGLVIALVGTPYFLWLLRRMRADR